MVLVQWHESRQQILTLNSETENMFRKRINVLFGIESEARFIIHKFSKEWEEWIDIEF